VFKKSNSPFSKDKWEQKRNQKIIEYLEDTKNDGRLLSKTGIIVALRKLKSYGFEFSFDDWDDPDVKAQYLQYKEWGSTTKPEAKSDEETSEIERNRKIAQTLFLKGSTTDEIAGILGKSISTVREYVHEVREKKKTENKEVSEEVVEKSNKEFTLV
jgi:DNA-binding CsgD family transcriptional regulator